MKVPDGTTSLEKDRSDFLEKHADDAKAAFLNNDSRGLWQSVKKLLRFGGRPARIGVDHAYILDEEGKPIPDSTKQAEVELDYFAKAEHSIITDADDIAKIYNRNAMTAATIRVLSDTPIENIMTKEENKANPIVELSGRSEMVVHGYTVGWKEKSERYVESFRMPGGSGLWNSAMTD